MHKRFLRWLFILGVVGTLVACGGGATAPEEEAAPAEEQGEEEAPAEEEAAPSEEEAAPEEEEAAPAEPLDVAFVLPGLINDGSFNTQAYNSILAAEEALGITTTYVEGLGAPTDAAKAIRDYAAEGYSVVWAQGGQYPSAVLEVAPDFPDTTFVTLAGPGMDLPENVWISGNEFESAYFLAGALAGLMTETNTVGYIGGVEIPVYAATAAAFTAGAEYTNPDVEVLVTFTGDFNDPTAAKEAAIGQIENGADIIIHSMNLGAFGLFEAAREAGDVWVIGKDIDQKTLAPDVVLTSVILDFEQQFQRILTAIAAGETGGYLAMSLSEGTIYLAPYYGQVPDDVAAEIEEIKAMLLAGEIEFPTAADL